MIHVVPISPPLSHYMHYAGAPSPAAWSLPLMGISGSHYRYTEDLLALDTCTATWTPPLWPVCFTRTVRLDSLLPFLFRHPDQQFARYIYQGLTCGFRIGFDHERVLLRASSNNHPSTRASPGVQYPDRANSWSLGWSPTKRPATSTCSIAVRAGGTCSIAVHLA